MTTIIKNLMEDYLNKYNELMIKEIVNQKKKIIELGKKKDKDLLANEPGCISKEFIFLYIAGILWTICCIITKDTKLIMVDLLILPFLIMDISINVDRKKEIVKIKNDYEKNLKEETEKYEKILKEFGFASIEEYNQKVEKIGSKIIEIFDEWTEKNPKFSIHTLYLTIDSGPIKQKEELIKSLHEKVSSIHICAWKYNYTKIKTRGCYL